MALAVKLEHPTTASTYWMLKVDRLTISKKRSPMVQAMPAKTVLMFDMGHIMTQITLTGLVDITPTAAEITAHVPSLSDLNTAVSDWYSSGGGLVKLYTPESGGSSYKGAIDTFETSCDAATDDRREFVLVFKVVSYS